jgi:hypothetical protein
VASVIATSAAIAIAMVSGYRTVLLLAALAYAIATITAAGLQRRTGTPQAAAEHV